MVCVKFVVLRRAECRDVVCVRILAIWVEVDWVSWSV